MSYTDAEREEAGRKLSLLRTGNGVKPGCDSRSLAITTLYANGATLQEIGKRLDLTPERIRQLMRKDSYYTTREIRKALQIEAETIEDMRREADRQTIIEWSEKHVGSTIADAAKALQMKPAYIKILLGDRARFHSHWSSRKGKLYSDEELIRMIKKFHKETGRTDASSFERWSLEHHGPTKQTPILRFGKWSKALEAAKIRQVRAVERKRNFNENDYWAAVIEYVESAENHASTTDLERWLRDRPEMPSAASLRNHLRLPWRQIHERAARILSGHTEGLDPQWVAEVTRKRDWAQIRERNRTHYDHVELLSRAFAAKGLPFTIARYDEWAKEMGNPRAISLLYTSKKKWNELLDEAEIPLNRVRMRISEEEALDDLVEYLHTGAKTTFNAYQEWAHKHGKVNAARLARDNGSWKKAVQAAQAKA